MKLIFWFVHVLFVSMVIIFFLVISQLIIFPIQSYLDFYSFCASCCIYLCNGQFNLFSLDNIHLLFYYVLSIFHLIYEDH